MSLQQDRRSFLVLVVVAALALASAATAGQLRSELVPLAGSVTAGEEVLFRFTLSNTGKDDVFVLAYETPLRGFERDLLRVTRDGEPIPYLGIMALRLGPAAEDWVRLGAGESVSAVVDLAAAYDLRRGGTYTVQFTGFLQVFRGSERRLPVAALNSEGELDEGYRRGVAEAVDSAELAGELVVAPLAAVTIEGDAPIQPVDEEELVAGAMAFYGCSNTSTLTSAQSTARSRAARAYNAIPSYNTFYRTWFGTTSSYVSTVRGRFANSYNRLGLTVDYYCGSYAPYCQPNYIAYTYKTTSNRIYICAAFWNQSASGMAHTIAHESFHWNTVAGADDVTYGYSNCLNLASTRPYDALRNADNYAYATTYAP
ncbi:MAG: hypothetical protein HRF46_14455 [Acidobacteriota bacterium]|jgi:peptidyl-Lys metalloendopeptidase